MTPRKLRFIEEYARLKNGKQAALAAGYGERCAAPMASRLLRRADVQEALIAQGVALAFAPEGVKQMTRLEPFLTERQERFVQHYLALGKGAEAARRAGYAKRSAGATADKLLNTPRVAAALAAGRAERAKRLQLDGERVLAEYARLAFADLGLFLEASEDGLRVKPLDALAAEERAALAQIVEQRGKSGSRLSVKLFDKQKALDALAKHLGLFEKRGREAKEQRTAAGDEARQILRERILKLIAAARGEKQD